MTKVLELRERLCSLYGRYEIYIKPAIRFMVAIVTFMIINENIGYMNKLRNPAIAIVLALVCTFLPMNATAILAAVLILVHLTALSLEACIVAFLLFLLMFFMYFKYAQKGSYCVVLTPVLCQLNLPQVMPTALGLCKEPYSVLSMACGMVVYYFLNGIKKNDALLSMSEDDAMMSRFVLVLRQIVSNKELYITVAAFMITAIVIYVIRIQSFKNAWTIAVVVGNALNMVILLTGVFLLENSRNVGKIIIGTIIAVGIGLLLEFFLFHLDYARTEQVQFEDDKYYYYVKAVPKVYVPTGEKKIKQINSRRSNGISKKDLADEFDIDQELLDD